MRAGPGPGAGPEDRAQETRGGEVGAQWARLACRRWGSCAGGEDPAQEVRIERRRLGSSAVGEDGAWAERRTHFRRLLNNY